MNLNLHGRASPPAEISASRPPNNDRGKYLKPELGRLRAELRKYGAMSGLQ